MGIIIYGKFLKLSKEKKNLTIKLFAIYKGFKKKF